VAIGLTDAGVSCVRPWLGQDNSWALTDYQKIHGTLGTLLGFLLALRASAANDRYYEGKLLRSSFTAWTVSLSPFAKPRVVHAI
jgi:predicted membrane chloride channel (bestrophin family)